MALNVVKGREARYICVRAIQLQLFQKRIKALQRVSFTRLPAIIGQR